ncbi:MAG: hypothetical protein ACK559_12955, partial [bacterium]
MPARTGARYRASSPGTATVSQPTPRWPAVVLLVGAAAGLLFSAVSTYDFAQHLDRQVHGLHCSFVPGLGTPDATGTSG